MVSINIGDYEFYNSYMSYVDSKRRRLVVNAIPGVSFGAIKRAIINMFQLQTGCVVDGVGLFPSKDRGYISSSIDDVKPEVAVR